MMNNCFPSVLIAADNPETARLIEGYLDKEEMATILASDGRQAIEMFFRSAPSLVILGVLLPKMDGFSVCRSIRQRSAVPILFLTARDAVDDRVRGLELGADDYVVKPFCPRELVARVKALLRRGLSFSPSRPRMEEVWEDRAPGLVYDPSKRRFTLNGALLTLTPLEFVLLQTLHAHPGKVFLRNELLDRLYPDGEIVVDRVIDVHIGKLRRKIGDNPVHPTYIQTVRGIGYCFSDDL
jgi:DNA-binding response OmpR family regulator